MPAITSGYTVLGPATSGGGSQTIPCGEFLQEVIIYEKSKLSIKASSTTQTSVKSSCAPFPKLKFTPAPTYTDTRLVGCYAGTATSTVFTVPSGYWLPDTQNLSRTLTASKQEVVTIGCSDFMRLPTFLNNEEAPIPGLPIAVSEAALSFKKSPICTSYAKWCEAQPDASWINDDFVDVLGFSAPPGVFNAVGGTSWSCCAACQFYMTTASVMYFPTVSYRGCTTESIPMTGYQGQASITGSHLRYTVVDGATLYDGGVPMALYCADNFAEPILLYTSRSRVL